MNEHIFCQTEALNEDVNSSRDEADKLREQVEALKLSLEHQKLRNIEAMNRKSNHPISTDNYETLLVICQLIIINQTFSRINNLELITFVL